MNVDSFEELVHRLAASADVHDAQAAIRLSAGDGAVRYVQDLIGKHRSTARRWLHADEYPRTRAPEIIALVSDNALAAEVLRRTVKITVLGRTDVVYKQSLKGQGSRDVPDVESFSANVHAYITDAVNGLLADGHKDGLKDATEALSNAIICNYEDGLEEVLGVADFDNISIT
ncbi:hypothetical protein [Actinokineospora sp. NBRC 105648]|uniref:hypothetical protein n=1 Tax=Actinokineospora sp. NBRC 105648 TaxID=3032206 RepID=UPI0024A0A031|nr:hypothetical protein [Actinokineospora sp. NBRC 105648]GLZ43503.1 hypothetical protein Acsp05_71270 [Actinokineospora sp. NBRC 105648]